VAIHAKGSKTSPTVVDKYVNPALKSLGMRAWTRNPTASGTCFKYTADGPQSEAFHEEVLKQKDVAVRTTYPQYESKLLQALHSAFGELGELQAQAKLAEMVPMLISYSSGMKLCTVL
jgi:hypothetical protein